MKRRLVAAAVAATATLVLAFCVPLASLVRDVARERAVAAAERDAAQLVGALNATSSHDRLAEVVAALDAGEGHIGTVLPYGRTIGTDLGDPGSVSLARTSSEPFEVLRGGDVVWVEPVTVAGGVAVVEVRIPAGELRRGVFRAWLTLGAVGVVLLAVGVAIADRFARTVTGPAVALADAAARVAAGDLEARVTPAGPDELVRVAEGFNDLAGRVGALITTEREAVADLAHRLRTPLAAMRLDAEGVGDAEQRTVLLSDVDALERAVDTVIREARRPQRHATAPVSDLGGVVGERVRFWSALADDQHRRWRADIEPGVFRVAVPPSDLAAAVDALLDNVFTHTPTGTAFTVQVAPAGPGHVQLVVRDEGPGFGDLAVCRGRSGGEGTGLGLDIAGRAAASGVAGSRSGTTAVPSW